MSKAFKLYFKQCFCCEEELYDTDAIYPNKKYGLVCEICECKFDEQEERSRYADDTPEHEYIKDTGDVVGYDEHMAESSGDGS